MTLCRRIGFQLYLECKNHNKPISGDEYSSHDRRMGEHSCNIGVLISTSGYKIGKGKGIAESIYINTIRNRFHLLLTICSLRSVISEKIPPLAVLTEALGYATNDRYQNDKTLQDEYSMNYCHQVAKDEYESLSSA